MNESTNQVGERKPSLRNEMSDLLNKYSREGNSNTPDYILAQFLMTSLEAFEAATNWRDKHFGYGAQQGAGIPIPESAGVSPERSSLWDRPKEMGGYQN